MAHTESVKWFYVCVIFMHRGAQMKLLLTQRAPRAASRGKSLPYSIAIANDTERKFFSLISGQFLTIIYQ